MWFLIMLFIVCVGGCWLIFKLIGNALFPNNDKRDVYIDRSVHHHYHDNRSVHVDKETFNKLGK